MCVKKATLNKGERHKKKRETVRQERKCGKRQDGKPETANRTKEKKPGAFCINQAHGKKKKKKSKIPKFKKKSE